MKKTFLCEKKVRRAIGLLLAFLLVFAYSCPTGIYAEASEKAPFTVISNEKELEVYKAEKTTSFEGMSVSFYSVDVEADSSITISGEDISVIIDYLPAGGEYDNLPVTMSIPTEGDPTISAVCTAGGIDDLAELIGEYESLASVYDPVGLNWSNTNSKAFRVEGIIGEEELAILTIRWVKSESDGDERVGFSLTAEDNTSVDVKSAGNYTLSGKELSLPMDLYFADLEGDSVTMDFDEGSAFAKLMDPLQSGLSFEGDNDFPATLEAPSGDVAKNSLTTLPWIDLLKYFKLESESTAQIAGLYSGIEGGWTNEGYRAYSAYVLYDAEEEMPKGILLLRWKAEETQTFDFGISDVSIDRGVSYSPFIENNDTYEFVLDNGVKDGTAILSFQVSDGVTNVKYGSDEDTVIEDGTSLQANEQSYQIQVAIDNNFVTPVGYDYNQSKEKKIYVALQKGNQTRVITLVVHQRAELALPLADSVVDYLCVGSQFTNGGNQNTGIYGWYPEKTLIGAYMSNTTWPNSLGNFGGYITYYFNTPITDDPKNPYGVDFTVYGNSFDGTSGASEPGAVMVSENGSTWYELAGSVFYDDSTTWNAEVTYQYNADSTTYKLSDGRNGAFNFVFNKLQGGSLSENYPLAAAKGVIDEENNKVTLKGTLITEMYPAFGYADVKSANPQLHEEASPYAENQKSADGFDLKWAVDPETGNPVDLSDAEIHYVKVYTANFSKGETNIGEQSTEVSYVVRQIGEDAEVGVTEVSGITLDGETVSFDSGNEAEVELEQSKSFDVSIKAGENANVYVNSTRAVYSNGEFVASFAQKPEKGVLRIIVQEGEKEPAIYYIKCGTADSEKNAGIDYVKVTPGDFSISAADFVDNATPECTVVNTVANIKLAIKPANAGATVKLKQGDIERTLTQTEGVYNSDLLEVKEGENNLTIEITSKDGTAINTYPLIVKRAAATIADDNLIKVKFTFTGDALHGKDEEGNPLPGHDKQIWIAQTEVTIPKGSTVKYLTDLMLYNSGIDFDDTDGTYIAKVKIPGSDTWLGEFDNGINSGWMYRHNGLIADVGYAARILNNNDTVEWFYTDDYKKETGYEGTWNDILNPDGSQISSTTQDITAVVKNDEATAKVTADDINKLIDDAVKNTATNINLTVKNADNADKVSVELPKASVSSIANKTDVTLTVTTPLGNVTMDKTAMSTAAKAASSSDLTIVLEKQSVVETDKGLLGGDAVQTKVSILSGGKEITDLGAGKVTISLPVATDLANKDLAVVYTDSDGKLFKVSGKLVNIDGKQYYQIETSKPETFTLAEAAKIDAAIKAQDGETDEEKAARIKAGVENTTIKLWSTFSKKNNIQLNWTKSKGYKVDYYEVFKSTKRFSGFGTKAYYKTSTGTKNFYINTKELKKGTRYFYKVRGVRVINGEKVCTQWSNKAWRISRVNRK